MNRRSFFRFLGAGAATLALSEAIPFGRVWSFPSKIVVPELSMSDFELRYTEPAVQALCNQIDESIRVGHTLRIRKPPVFQPYASRPIVEYDQYIVTSVHPPQVVPA